MIVGYSYVGMSFKRESKLDNWNISIFQFVIMVECWRNSRIYNWFHGINKCIAIVYRAHVQCYIRLLVVWGCKTKDIGYGKVVQMSLPAEGADRYLRI